MTTPRPTESTGSTPDGVPPKSTLSVRIRRMCSRSDRKRPSVATFSLEFQDQDGRAAIAFGQVNST